MPSITTRKINVLSYPFLALAISFMLLLSHEDVKAQSSKEENRKAIMRDTLDGKLDFSRFLIDAHGFIPVPMIITEPALGGFGVLLAPVFIQPKKVEGYKGYLPPDITAAFGMYTSNDSYAMGMVRIGSFPTKGLKYRIGALYGSLNLSYYRTIPQLGEQSFEFNIKSLPLFVSVSKKILKQGIYLGLKYAYANTEIKPLFESEFPEFFPEAEFNSTIGSLGTFLEWDKRDNIFTPNNGFIANISFGVNDSWTASDYSFQRLDIPVNYFFSFSKKWISGFRFEMQQVFDKPPFFLEPFILMRGVPAARYQGETTWVLETEQRFDFNPRWSVLGFVGYGKAVEQNETFSEGQGVLAGGTGFRYLIARAFKIRAGIDIAFSPDTFAWYIVFGHNWNR